MSVIRKYIRQDLLSLYNTNKIANAQKLNDAIGKQEFCTNMIPFYFTGNESAKTVLVMLNPGAEDNCFDFRSLFGNQPFELLFEKHIDERINYGKYDFSRNDNFDLKQAAFLYHFAETGITIPQKFWLDDCKKKEAKMNVLQDKLQLELIPYCSRTFKGLFDSVSKAKKNVNIIEEHMVRLMNVINEAERDYVIFCSKQFYHIFNALESKNQSKWVIEKGEILSTKIGEINYSYSNIVIHFNNTAIKAGIAHSFASHALPNAFVKMTDYGKFCYENLI